MAEIPPTPTTLPTITPKQFAQRMAALFPVGWASNDAKSPGGVLFSVMQALAQDMTFEVDTSLLYAFDAQRIQFATDGALDLAALDFFGTGVYALPRLSGESDAAYAARILASLLPTGATRQAVSDSVKKVTGSTPRIIEPWSPADTGVWDGVVGGGAGFSPGFGQGFAQGSLAPFCNMMFWDVDTAVTPFRWTGYYPYQGFIECVLPFAQPFGNNPTPCYDVSTQFYWDLPNIYGAWFIDPASTTILGAQAVYNAINRTKCEGTIAWVKFVSSS